MNCSCARSPLAAALRLSRTKVFIRFFLSLKFLTNVDLDLLRLRLFRLRKGDGEDAVLVGGIHLIRVDSRRQGDAAAEFTGEPLGSRSVFAVRAVLGFAFAADRQHSVVQRNLDVFL